MRWSKFTERECDLFTAFCILKGYTKYLEKHVGVNFKNFLLKYEMGVVNSYRESSEYKELLDKLKKSRERFLPVLNELAEKNRQLTEFLEIQDIESKSNKEVSKLFKKFADIYQHYFPVFTLPKYFGMVLEESDLSVEVQNKIRDLRGSAYFEKIQDCFLPLIFGEISKRFKIPVKSLYVAQPEEIISIIDENPLVDLSNLLKPRIEYCLSVVNDGVINIYTGMEAKIIEEKELASEREIQATKEVAGRPACRGKVSGIVKRVIYKEELTNLENKILVTPMTSIRFVPYLKGVKAIITDEGGIACHAAIVSRELNIPCIIGTKIATKVLKDGDLVEADADKGIVKILERSTK